MPIAPLNFDKADVQALLKQHVAEAQADDCTHALNLRALQAPEIAMFSLRDDGGALMGFAALKALSETEGEIKSVRTHPDHLRKGVSQRLMDHIEALGRARGYEKLLLETHPTPQYDAARALYLGRGYTYRGAFGDYHMSPKSVFMELRLRPPSPATP